MAATIRDVARAAGVSSATVSYYLNDTKPLTPDTTQRIEQAMAELKFRRNPVARALASRRSRIIALAYPFSDEHESPSARHFIIGAARAASDRDHNLVVWPVDDDGPELATFAEQGLVDGVVLMDVRVDDPRVEALGKLGVPVALIGRTGDSTTLPYVDIDFDESVRLAFDHLTGLGHRRIVLVNGDPEDGHLYGYGPYVRTEAAYRRLMAEWGLDPIVMVCGQTVVDGRAAAGRLLAAHPDTTAVIVMKELPAPGLTAELIQRGRSVPGDISVMSMYSTANVAAMSTPNLTTVTTPGTELGALGVEALLKHLGGFPVPPTLATGRLVIGASTGPAKT
ncbi:LacI family DNA-binding transcriptional regulator [Actinoplanes sp. NPDC049265]|uniref:LacI family DNA-binding transcriptional regulator n=1 Tax=Actinoplanes sp. NPDC049265 TaxID=3363902 RepID=UPI0037124B32